MSVGVPSPLLVFFTNKDLCVQILAIQMHQKMNLALIGYIVILQQYNLK